MIWSFFSSSCKICSVFLGESLGSKDCSFSMWTVRRLEKSLSFYWIAFFYEANRTKRAKPFDVVLRSGPVGTTTSAHPDETKGIHLLKLVLRLEDTVSDFRCDAAITPNNFTLAQLTWLIWGHILWIVMIVRLFLLEISASVLALSCWIVNNLENCFYQLHSVCFSPRDLNAAPQIGHLEQCSSLPLNHCDDEGWNGTDAFSMQLIFFFVCLRPFKKPKMEILKAQKPSEVTLKLLFLPFFFSQIGSKTLLQSSVCTSIMYIFTLVSLLCALVSGYGVP